MRVERIHLRRHESAHARTRSVRTHHEVVIAGFAVAGCDPHTLARFHDVFYAGSHAQAFVVARAFEQPEQIAARKKAQIVRVVGRFAHRRETAMHAKPMQHARAERVKPQYIGLMIVSRRGFDDVRRNPALPEQRRQSEPRYAAACDQYAQNPTSPSGWSLAACETRNYWHAPAFAEASAGKENDLVRRSLGVGGETRRTRRKSGAKQICTRRRGAAEWVRRGAPTFHESADREELALRAKVLGVLRASA